jgi:hypothetical protein
VEERPTLERYQDTVYVDIFARDLRELGLLEAAVDKMHKHQFPTYGAAVNPRYWRESKTYLEEASNRLRYSYLFTASYMNANKLLAQ